MVPTQAQPFPQWDPCTPRTWCLSERALGWKLERPEFWFWLLLRDLLQPTYPRWSSVSFCVKYGIWIRLVVFKHFSYLQSQGGVLKSPQDNKYQQSCSGFSEGWAPRSLLTLHFSRSGRSFFSSCISFTLASGAWKPKNSLCVEATTFIRVWKGLHIKPLSPSCELIDQLVLSHLCRTWGNWEKKSSPGETAAPGWSLGTGSGSGWEQVPPESPSLTGSCQEGLKDQGVRREEAPGNNHRLQFCLKPALPHNSPRQLF